MLVDIKVVLIEPASRTNNIDGAVRKEKAGIMVIVFAMDSAKG